MVEDKKYLVVNDCIYDYDNETNLVNKANMLDVDNYSILSEEDFKNTPPEFIIYAGDKMRIINRDDGVFVRIPISLIAPQITKQ